jgi:spermidine/putrescine transport system substrate-binding protein
LLLVFCLAFCLALTGCTQPPITLTVYGWTDELAEDVFVDFTAATGIKVESITYESTEEAVENLRSGQAYDVVVIENRFIPSLVKEGLLATIDRSRLPNFRNISLNFRDLMYDPGNRYAIPYSWGTTGLLVRTDLVAEPVRHWADLWDALCRQGCRLARPIARGHQPGPQIPGLFRQRGIAGGAGGSRGSPAATTAPHAFCRRL